MSTKNKLAILFADICGSTALYDTLGDEKALALIARSLDIMIDEIAPQQGWLVRTIGDEILCVFPSAEAALLAACAMQKRIRGTRFETNTRLAIRIGFHYGDVICENDDVFGDTVNVAARIAALAKAGNIMTSHGTVNALPARLRQHAQRFMSAEFKGKQEETAIYMVNWEEDNERTKIAASATNHAAEPFNELTLSYGQQTFKVNKHRKSLLVGRGEQCDIVIPSTFASRMHARFELRGGKFSLVDQSTNGSYVRTAQGNITHLTRQEMILQNSGCVSFGQRFTDHPSELIEYSVNQAAERASEAN